MEADWEFEVAPEAPVIDAAWPGYVDLCAHPERALQLPEAQVLPALSSALGVLNAPGSPVWTAKCDVWETDAVDPDELEATPETAVRALSCYVDLLPSSDGWSTLEGIADWCRGICAELRTEALRQCRVDLVVRRAFLTTTDTGLGITVYVTGCGATKSAAADALSAALDVLARGCTR